MSLLMCSMEKTAHIATTATTQSTVATTQYTASSKHSSTPVHMTSNTTIRHANIPTDAFYLFPREKNATTGRFEPLVRMQKASDGSAYFLEHKVGSGDRPLGDLEYLESTGYKISVDPSGYTKGDETFVYIGLPYSNMLDAIYSILHSHIFYKTAGAEDARKWLACLKKGISVYLTPEGFTTTKPKSKEPVKQSKKKSKTVLKKTTPPKPTPVKEVLKKEFKPASPPKVNAWTKGSPVKSEPKLATVEESATDEPTVPSIVNEPEPVKVNPVEDQFATSNPFGALDVEGESDSEESAVEPQVEEVQEEQTPAPDSEDTEDWNLVGKPTIAPIPKKFLSFIYLPKGRGLKIEYPEGKPCIFQMAENGDKTEIGWVKEMQTAGYHHLRTPEDGHLFFPKDEPHEKLTAFRVSLGFTIKNGTSKQRKLAQDVLSWSKIFITKNAQGELTWSKSFKQTKTKDKPAQVVPSDEDFPVLS